MATLDDMATLREELDREIALKNRKPQLDAIGSCYNCGEETKGCFCDADCRADYEQRKRFAA